MSPCLVCGERDRARFSFHCDGFIKLYRCKECSFVGQYEGPGETTLIHDYSDAYALDFTRHSRFR
jgi:hypothetical protein